MRTRRLIGMTLAGSFVATVVWASFGQQCPASQLGACARIHLELMRPRAAVGVVLAAEPMRAAPRG
jgi:hypothetical protein